MSWLEWKSWSGLGKIKDSCLGWQEVCSVVSGRNGRRVSVAMSIGLAMIVKNGGKDLRPCLASVVRFVDQIVIVDTGSTDDTRAIASEFGAVVASFPWVDHFSEARNAGLRVMNTDWVLVIDADEEIEPDAAANIVNLVKNCGETVGGFHVISRHYMPTRFVHTLRGFSTLNEDRNERAHNASSYVETGNCRLFRRHPGIFYTGRVHEKVEPQIQTLGMKIESANFRVLHYGRLAGNENREAKDRYYYRLCQLKAEEEPGNVDGWLELGLVAFETFKDYAGALRFLEKAVSIKQDLPMAWFVMMLIHQAEQRYLQALEASDRVPDRPPLGMLKDATCGDAFHGLKRLKEAQRSYRRALESCRELPELQSCALLADLESKLGYTNVGLGLTEPGLATLRHAAEKAPHIFELQNRLMKGYLLAGQIDAAAQTSAAMARLFRDSRLYVRSATIQIQAGQIEQAKTFLDEAMALHPHDPQIAKMRNELLAS